MENKTKKSVYEMITERIVEQLEGGIIPWQKPWTGGYNGAFNRVSKKSYSLINQLMLKHQGEYATFKQWQDLGGHVKRGEKSEIVVFWKIFDVVEKDDDGKTETKHIPMLRYINVFHISQIEGVEPLSEKARKENNPIEDAEKILHDYWERENITIEQNTLSNEAYYAPLRDAIHLPKLEQFVSSNEYYSTAFHESVHSTMLERRCNRQSESMGIAAFGGENYSKEELVAEIGSANLMNIVGIETPKTFKNSSAYIQSWLQVLKNDTKFIVSASSKAEKAVKYILNEDAA